MTEFMGASLGPGGVFPRTKAILFRLAAFCVLLSGTVRAEAVWESAREAYRAGKFEEAKGDYLQLQSQGGCNAALFYNLGNTWWRLGQKGRAILNYRRALVLEPEAADTNANLRYALSQTGQELPSAFRTKLSRYADVYPVVASGAFWAAVFALAVGVTARRNASSRIANGLAGGFGLLCLVSLGLCWSVDGGDKDPHAAVVLPTSLDLKIGPAVSTRIEETIGEGQQVTVLQERGAWTYCRSETGLAGWVPSGSVEKIVPR